MKSAIIIIGELRFESLDHFNCFVRALDGYDVFVSTYEEYENICSKISSNYLLHPRNIPVELGALNSKGALLEWFHLDSILRAYKDELLEYSNILKVRTDLILSDVDFLAHVKNLEPDTLYASTNILFYSRGNYFIRMFEDFFSKIKTDYWDKVEKYIPLNYDHILQSDIGDSPPNCPTSTAQGVRFNWLVLPEKIIETQKPYPGDFCYFKEIIKQNYDFLIKFNAGHERDHPVAKLREFPPRFKFSSEQIFAVHAFNGGPVKNSSIPVGLYPGRRAFNFNIDH